MCLTHYIGDEDEIDMVEHGTLGEYDTTRQDWLSYTKRLQQYFATNDVRSVEKQCTIFLSTVGASTYQLIKSLLVPSKPSESFGELVKRPSPAIAIREFQCYMFNTCIRKQGETITLYVAELRRLVEHYNYGDSLNEMLPSVRHQRQQTSAQVAGRGKPDV